MQLGKFDTPTVNQRNDLIATAFLRTFALDPQLLFNAPASETMLQTGFALFTERIKECDHKS